MASISIQDAKEIARQFFNLQVKSCALLSSEWGGTFKIEEVSEKCFLLKVSPDHVSESRTIIEIEIATHLYQQKINVPALVSSADGDVLASTSHGLARMYTWINGRLLAHVKPHSDHLLRNIGIALGELTGALQNFEPGQSIPKISWRADEPEWTFNHIELFNQTHAEIFEYFKELFTSTARPHLPALRKSLLHNDANDYNILIEPDPYSTEIAGFIDFGDVTYGPTICELAVCLAYVMMQKEDPIAAARAVISGYHTSFPITEKELEVLFPLIASRLMISVTHAALRYSTDPTNNYWQIGADDAWGLLQQLKNIHPHFALAHFRAACGYEPCPFSSQIKKWLTEHRQALFPVTGFDLAAEPVTVFDWSVGSLTLGNIGDLDDIPHQTYQVFRRMEKENTRVGIGRYNEPRPVYTTHAYSLPGNNGPVMRTVHLGIDIFMPAGTSLYAPYDGRVYLIVNDTGDKEYGPLLILEHLIESANIRFYTLYGHNDPELLNRWKPGDVIKKGDEIALIGNYPENGNWVPHLHFQIISHMLGYTDDYPGVADADQLDVWLSLCPDPNIMLGIDHPDITHRRSQIDDLIKVRESRLGPNLSLSYLGPLHIVRGWKTTLYDAEGRAYLDTHNNIAHVGHAHPAVVQAGNRQMAVLNTNSRYLHKTRLGLAGKLKEKLPGHLEHIYFTNSGSEANELALCMARTFTGEQATLVMDHGYHGNTQATMDVSHYKYPAKDHRLPNISVLPSPDKYRGTFAHRKDKEEFISKNAAEVTRKFCAEKDAITFLHESVLSCAGQIVPPDDYFLEIYAAIKKHGGVCIADEVQTGLGRVGEKYWAFELFGLAPDIVTIGKPLGNGHPVAAVAVTRAVAEKFSEGPEYFNSFGGNPVSCAIGLEVLNTIEKEHLQEYARENGNYWKKALMQLKEKYPIIGDVRGHGLFLGIEFSKDQETKAPAARIAHYIMERLLQHRILTSLDGPDENVMKIKPPMCIIKAEVDYFLEVFEKVLGEDVVKLS